ncbi:E3 ubiquitin-protein ligase lubel-like [Ornithodoros turicata]|uniref:E3 ubiquitin-protein ligase lubel-like n=1 Tax=Ornithodoros turicata TaxID=34597 RepID=UPI0031391833
MDALECSTTAYRKTAHDIIVTSKELVDSGECPDMGIATLASLLCKMGFTDDYAVSAARNRCSIEGALRYLKTATFVKCEICTRDVEPHMMLHLIPCDHGLCEHCCNRYFTTKIRNEPVLHLTCYKCSVEINIQMMFQKLKRILNPSDHNLLEKKLLDFYLQDVGKYCPKCHIGFEHDPTLQRPMCPSCNATICGKCWLLWEDQHKNISCDDFKRWKQENAPEFQETHLEHILSTEGVICPKCHHRYSLARGGCLHFICIKCKHEFCMCCRSQFHKGKDCKVAPDCVNKGLHAHHPRNCFYNVRDYPEDQLIKLVKETGHEVDETPAEANSQCTIKTTDDSMREIPCNGDVHKADKCKKHFMEYLGEIISNNNIDTVPLMSVNQLTSELAKNGKQIPEKHPSEDDDTYLDRLREIVMESLPIRQGAEEHE